MRRIRYQVACSLDGFIATAEDAFDWITPEPSFDFEAHMAQFDTLLMGRRTFEIIRSMGETFPGKQVLVASQSLRQTDFPDVETVFAVTGMGLGGYGRARRDTCSTGRRGADVPAKRNAAFAGADKAPRISERNAACGV